MDNPNLAERLEIVKPLVRQAAKIAMAKFGRISGQSKKDGTLVTEADKEVEECLVKGLSKEFPQENIIGEETGWHKANSELVWSIDPIDGTSAYLCRLPSWGVSVGLIENGVPILGVVYLPVLDELYWGARGQGAYLESKLWGLERLDITKTDLDQKEHLILVPSTFHHRFSLKIRSKMRSLGSTVAHALTVARGDAAGAIMRIFHWDVAGSLPILLEAGGCIDCLGGRPFQIKELNKENPQLPVLILSNPQAREQLIHSIQVK